MGQSEGSIDDFQEVVMLLRRIQLSIGCAVMLFMILRICFKKLYVYNTTKMFMWCCLCYLVGMAVVLPHTDLWTDHHRYVTNQNPTLAQVLQNMKQKGPMAPCGLEAFVNLYFYDLGYFFAVLVTYNVFCVLNNNYRKFMRTLLKNPVIIAFLLFMLMAHLLPLILLYTHSNFQQYYSYSYGPTGFRYPYEDQTQPNLLLYCGICFNPSFTFTFLAISTMYICPIIMFIVHSIILCRNHSRIRVFENEEYLNSKQQFILRSGKISTIVFIIQAINLIKLALSLLPINCPAFSWIIIVINFLFDLYPLVLLGFYLRYTKQKQGVQGADTLIQQENQ